MSITYTFTEARQNLTTVLAQAEKDGEVRITHRGGKVFVLKLEKSHRSPLDVKGVFTEITRDEIIESLRESREQDITDRRNSY